MSTILDVLTYKVTDPSYSMVILAAALADDFAPDGPEDVFSRTPEPWGGPARREEGTLGGEENPQSL